MDDRKELKNRERIVKQKTSDLICKKYRDLKTGKLEEDIALERHFKPIIEPLKQIVENTVGDKPVKEPIKNEKFFSDEKKEYMEPKLKRKRSNASFENSSTSIKSMKIVLYTSNETPKILKSRKSYEPFVEDVYEIADESLEKSVRQFLQMRQSHETLHSQLGSLRRRYVSTFLGDDRRNEINHYDRCLRRVSQRQRYK